MSLQDENIQVLCSSIPAIVEQQCDDHSLKERATNKCKKFEEIFKLYGKCHFIFNSSNIMGEKTLKELGMQ